MLDYLIYLPRFFKKSLLILNDIILAIITINLAYFIRLEDIFLLSPEQSLIILISILIVIETSKNFKILDNISCVDQ